MTVPFLRAMFGSVVVLALAVHAEAELLVADTASGNVLAYTASGGFSGVLIAAGSGGLGTPTGLALGSDGNLYVADGPTGSVLRFDQSGNFIDTFISAGSAGLSSPRGLAFDALGNLYVASAGTGQILEYDSAGAPSFSPFVDTGVGGLSAPAGLAFDTSGDLFVASGSGQVFEYDTSGFPSLSPPIDTGGDPTTGLTFDSLGNLYVGVAGFGDDVLRFDPMTTVTDTFVANGLGGLNAPAGLTFGPDGDLYVASATSGEVLRYDAAGNFLDSFISPGLGGLDAPGSLLFLPDEPAPVVPEPATLTLFGFGLAGIAAWRRLSRHRFVLATNTPDR